MTYSPPAKATFIANFPAFADIEDAPYTLWSGKAGRSVGIVSDSMDADDADIAAMLLTAHYLTLQGLGTGTEAALAAQGASGFTRFKSASLELERSPGDGGPFMTTSYGQQAWAMLRPFLAGPRVTGTGTQPDLTVPW